MPKLYIKISWKNSPKKKAQKGLANLNKIPKPDVVQTPSQERN